MKSWQILVDKLIILVLSLFTKRRINLYRYPHIHTSPLHLPTSITPTVDDKQKAPLSLLSALRVNVNKKKEKTKIHKVVLKIMSHVLERISTYSNVTKVWPFSQLG